MGVDTIPRLAISWGTPRREPWRACSAHVHSLPIAARRTVLWCSACRSNVWCVVVWVVGEEITRTPNGTPGHRRTRKREVVFSCSVLVYPEEESRIRVRVRNLKQQEHLEMRWYYL